MTATAARELTDVEERNLKSVADVLPFWNKGDIEGILSFYDDEIVWTNVGLGEVYDGKDEVRGFLERIFTALPDLVFTVHHKIAYGDNVAERWTIEGTHLGPFLGIPATGRPVTVKGVVIDRLVNSRMTDSRILMDTFSLMIQLGVIPQPA